MSFSRRCAFLLPVVGLIVVGFWLSYTFSGFLIHQMGPVKRYYNAATTREKGQQTAYLCYKPGGRLGNQMFGYASAFSLAKRKGMQLVSLNTMRQHFRLSSTCDTDFQLWGNVCEQAEVLFENDATCNALDTGILAINGTQSLRIYGCLRSWHYLTGQDTEIRREFTFRDFIQANARKALHSAIGGRQLGDRVFVGVHVRRGDRLYIEALPVPDQNYYRKAMDFMRAKFKAVVFVVCSEDIGWAKANLFTADTVFVDTKQAAVDMAVLALCNHTIMSVGTFGWWASWLANGTTVYYKHAFKLGTHNFDHSVMREYMPTHWISME